MKKLFVLCTILFIGQVCSPVYGQSKTAHVNTMKLMDTLPSRKKALAEILEVTKRGEQELIDLNKQLQTAYSQYMEKKKDQSEQVNQYEESRLKKLQEDLQKREQELNTMIQNMNVTMNDRTYKLLQEATKNVANKKGFQYVIDEGTTLYAGGTNITNDVITELIRLDGISSN